MSTSPARDSVEAPGRGLVSRIVCGVDGSRESDEAVRQATRLAPSPAHVVLAAVCETHLAAQTGVYAPEVLHELELGVTEALSRARGRAPGASARLLRGDAADELARAARAERATLIALGAHGLGRAVGIILGSVATRLIHEAPCSVLLARPAIDNFPTSIVVGLDGSRESLAAATVARELAARLGAELRTLVATGGKPIDVDGVAGWNGEFEFSHHDAVGALVAASAGADLVVVGSRGLHGLAALGSVSERVAHRAASSVLVVRDAG